MKSLSIKHSNPEIAINNLLQLIVGIEAANPEELEKMLCYIEHDLDAEYQDVTRDFFLSIIRIADSEG